MCNHIYTKSSKNCCTVQILVLKEKVINWEISDPKQTRVRGWMIWKPENTMVCWNIGTQLHDKSLGLSRFIYHCTQPSQFVTNKETGPPDSGWGLVGNCQSCPGSQRQASSVRRVGDRPGEPAHAYTDDAFTILSAEPRHLIKNISEMVKIYDEISNISALTESRVLSAFHLAYQMKIHMNSSKSLVLTHTT